MNEQLKTLTQAFLTRIKKVGTPPQECWEWDTPTASGRMPKFLGEEVHRLSYKLFKGEIPARTSVKRLCDNSLCLNPNHLTLVGENTGKRFWDLVQKHSEDECWPWKGAVKTGGYGQFGGTSAHRIAYTLSTGLPIPKGMYICHHCDNPPCCNPAHLFLGTPSENNLDKIRKGRGGIGSLHGRSKLTEQQVLEIHSLIEQGVRHPDIAAKYGVARITIARISANLNWKHLDKPSSPNSNRRVGFRKLKPEHIPEIRSLREQGWTHQKIADQFGVDRATIGYVLRGNTWQEVKEMENPYETPHSALQDE